MTPTQPGLTRIRQFLLLASFLAYSPFASALDLMQAYTSALGQDAELAESEAALSSAREQVPISRAATLPSLSLDGSLARQWEDNSAVPSVSFTQRNVGLNLRYPLYRPQNTATLDQARLRATAAEFQYEGVRQNLIIRTAQAYFDLLAAHNNLETVLAQKAAITEQLAAAKRNFQLGSATVADQQEAQARFDLTVAQELASRNALAVAQSALSILTGQQIAGIIQLPPAISLADLDVGSEEEWVSSAIEGDLAVRQAVIAVEVAKREVQRQQYAKRPTVDLVGSVANVRNPSSTFLNTTSNNKSVGVQFGIPIYTGGGVSAQTRQAVANLKRAEAELLRTRRTAEQTSRQAYLGLINGLGQVKALEAAEASSELALKSNRVGYRVGVRINVDVLNAQQQLYETRRDLARARYDVLINNLLLRSTTGQLTEQNLETVAGLLTEPIVVGQFPREDVNPAPSQNKPAETKK